MKIQLYFRTASIRLLISLALALAALTPGTAAPSAARASGAYVVDTATDGPDVVDNGICNNTIDGCSLRAAIDQATADGVPTTITFAIGLDGQTLLLNDAYGTILWDGSNITVTTLAFNITVSGANLSGSQSLFQISGSHNTLNNLTLKDAPGSAVSVGDFYDLNNGNFNLLSGLNIIGNGAAGITVSGGGTSGGLGNRILSDYIGMTDPFALGCAGEGNTGGVIVGLEARATTIESSIIGCSSQHGVVIDGSGGSPLGTLITNTAIGINLANPIPNGLAGVAILDAQDIDLETNLISGNGSQGIYVTGAAARPITITHNLIGTGYNGNSAVPNLLDGILVNGVSLSSTLIVSNTISGNGAAGVHINNSAYVSITNNLIGVDVFGIAAIPNDGDGV
ncbi:MAG: right-handed parallel beta-helix repeat-containing protein, partial [Anaerolineales bacterium]